MININKQSEDPNYRYKMPKVIVRIAGRGNGSYTFLDNIDDVSTAINTPSLVLLNFISRSLGSSCNLEKNTITGHYTYEKIEESIYNFINFFVLCKKCSIPETIPQVGGNKKNKILEFKCSACGNTSEVSSSSKLYGKMIDFIIKNKDLYVIKKGNLVEKEEKDLFNPF